MEILIKIENREIKVMLLQGKKEVDSFQIFEERSLSEKLLPEIDKLLKKNKLTFRDIKKMRVQSDQTDSFTTTRIAKAVAKAWNFGLQNRADSDII
jgi:tRNA A37 threonylcarbamoyladenosine modification protein TsaB